MKLPPDLEARCLALAGQTPEKSQPKVRREKPALVTPAHIPPHTWTVPIVTTTEVNDRNWKGRSARTHAARRAVSKVFGEHLAALVPFAEHYHQCRPLRIVFTRLGGRKCDRSNLPTAIKAVEDALALMLGADDGDPCWRPEFEQEPGSGLVGVRIELYRVRS